MIHGVKYHIYINNIYHLFIKYSSDTHNEKPHENKCNFSF